MPRRPMAVAMMRMTMRMAMSVAMGMAVPMPTGVVMNVVVVGFVVAVVMRHGTVPFDAPLHTLTCRVDLQPGYTP